MPPRQARRQQPVSFGSPLPGGGLRTSNDPTGTLAWRSLYARLKGEHVVTHNLIVSGGTVAAGLLGVAFQVLVSHHLRPADYGEVFAVITLITLIGLPASAFTLLMARETSRDRARGQYAGSAALLRGGNRALVVGGLALASGLALSSPLLAGFLDVSTPMVLAAAAGIPFGFALPILLGEFQGEQRFVAYSLLAAGQAGLKLLAAVTLGLLFGPVGIIAGISLASAAVYVVALSLLRRKMSTNARLPWWRPAATYLAVVLPSTLALAVLLSADVLLVKHFFPTRTAGEYAAVAAVGRAIFWGASGVAAVLFPKVIFRGAQGQSGSHLVGASLALVALGGSLGLGLLVFGSKWLLTAFAGAAYAGAAGYLPWYALGMILLGGSAVLIATHQSHGKAAFLWILLPLTMLEPALIAAFHQSPVQVVQVVDVSMALVFAGLAALYVVQERAGLLTSASVATNLTAASTIPHLQVNR